MSEIFTSHLVVCIYLKNLAEYNKKLLKIAKKKKKFCCIFRIKFFVFLSNKYCRRIIIKPINLHFFKISLFNIFRVSVFKIC